MEVLISSSVRFTADTTVEEFGLLPLATISRNLTDVAEEATEESASRRRLNIAKHTILSAAAIDSVALIVVHYCLFYLSTINFIWYESQVGVFMILLFW